MAEIIKLFVGILVQTKTSKRRFEINWPLVGANSTITYFRAASILANLKVRVKFCNGGQYDLLISANRHLKLAKLKLLQKRLGPVSSYHQCTLLVLFKFCPVMSEFVTQSFVYKHFWYFDKNCQWKSNLGLTFLHFEFSNLYIDIFGISPKMQIQGFKLKM